MRKLLIAGIVAAGGAFAQDATERIAVPFSDPSGAKQVQCTLMRGSISVKTHGGNDVIVEAKPGTVGKQKAPPAGMHRVGGGGSGLTVEESANVVRIHGDSRGGAEITILVPAAASLKLNTVNGGGINVDGVSGEIDAKNLNGDIKLSNVSGAVVAHTLNGKVVVTMNQVAAGKPMSFSTLNGDIDVTMPATAKANLKMKSEHGDIFSDFEIALKPTTPPQPTAETTSGKRRYRVRFDRASYGTINGGGPEFQFTTLNGTISLRKK